MRGTLAAGIICGILAGMSTFVGQVLQKAAVNKIPYTFADRKYSFLLRNKIWLTGLLLYIGGATVFYMAAEFFIGPVLVPGLMTTGLIALVIASAVILKEKITLNEIMEMLVLSIGIVCITSSKLVINYRHIDLKNLFIMYRIIGFTLCMIIIWGLLDFLVKKSVKQKLFLKSLAAGLPYVLSNLWILPLYVSISAILNRVNSALFPVFFISSAIILIVVNILGITELQTAYKFGKVSVVVPFQQIPIQIAPFFYYLIFYPSFPPGSGLRIGIGIFLIIISGFIPRLNEKRGTS